MPMQINIKCIVFIIMLIISQNVVFNIPENSINNQEQHIEIPWDNHIHQSIQPTDLEIQYNSIIENNGQRRDIEADYYCVGNNIPATFGIGLVSFMVRSRENAEGVIIQLQLIGANQVSPIGINQLEERSNYFIGDDPEKWVVGVRHYNSVQYPNIWDGVDLVFHSHTDGWKYEFNIINGSCADQISLGFKGVDEVKVDVSSNSLLIQTLVGTLTDTSPVSFQYDDNGLRNTVPSRFIEKGENVIGFDVIDFDPSRPLVIDPKLSWSTYCGSPGDDKGYKVCTDAQGNTYVVGHTENSNFPSTPGSFDPSYNGDYDVFIMKFGPGGTPLLFSTYLGDSKNDNGYFPPNGEPPFGGIVVDKSGAIFISGSTSSSNFPTTSGAYDTQIATRRPDLFVTKLSPKGDSLSYSTFIGGNGTDFSYGIAVDDIGSAYIAGTTEDDFPTTPGAYNQNQDTGTNGFILKLNPSGSSLEYSTYISGSYSDFILDLAIDKHGQVYATGWTESDDFPTTEDAFDDRFSGNYDVFILKMNADGTDLNYSTFIGSSQFEEANAIDIDEKGRAYVTGYSQGGFPTTQKAYDRYYNGSKEAFILRLSSDGKKLEASTYLGGSNNEEGMDIKVDAFGNVHMTGWAESEFPATDGAYDDSHNGGKDVILVQMTPDLQTLQYSTFFGGSGLDEGWGLAVDDEGDSFITGWTASSNFPMVNAYDDSFNGGTSDVFVLEHKGFRPPVWASPGTLQAVEDIPYKLVISDHLEDPDTPDVSLTLSSGSGYLTDVTGLNATLSFPNGVLNATVPFKVTDGIFNITFSVDFEITPVNDPPEITLTSPVYATEEVTLILDLRDYVIDVDNETSDLMVSADSPYSSLDGFNLTLLFPNGITEYDLTIMVSDGLNVTTKIIRFLISSVNDPPVVAKLDKLTIFEDTVTIFNLTPFLSDADTPIEELTVFVPERNCTVEGQLLSFLFSRGGFEVPVDIRVSDGPNSVHALLIVEVVEVDDPPYVLAILPQTFREDELGSIDLAPYISDEDTDIDDISVDCSHPAVDSISGLIISFLYKIETPDHTVLVTVSDLTSGVEDSFEVSVRATNDPVQITDFGGLELPYSVRIQEGKKMWLQITAADEDNDIFKFSLVTAGVVTSVHDNGSVLVSPEFGQVGTFHPIIQVSDHNGSTIDINLEVVVININEPPAVPIIKRPLNGAKYKEGDNITFLVEVDDPDLPFGDTLSVSWTSNISGTFMVMDDTDTYSFTTDVLEVGTHRIIVTVTDGEFTQSSSIDIVIEKKENGLPPNGNHKPDDPTDEDSNLLLYILLAIVLVCIVAIGMVLLKKKKQEL